MNDFGTYYDYSNNCNTIRQGLHCSSSNLLESLRSERLNRAERSKSPVERSNYAYITSSSSNRMQSPPKLRNCNSPESPIYSKQSLYKYDNEILNIKQERIAKLENHNSELQSKISDLERTIHNMNSYSTKNSNSAKDELTELNKQIKAKDNELLFYQSNIKKLEDEVNYLLEKNNNFIGIINDLEANYQHRMFSYEEMKAHNYHIFQENETSLLLEIKDLRNSKIAEINEILYNHDKEMEKIINLHNDIKSKLIQNLREKEDDYNKLVYESKSNEKKLNEVITQKNSEIKNLSEKLQLSEQQNSDLTQANLNLSNELHSSKQNHKQKEEEINALKDVHSDLLNNHNVLQGDVEKFNRLAYGKLTKNSKSKEKILSSTGSNFKSSGMNSNRQNSMRSSKIGFNQ